jgi:glycosyltransferase involved in cell wall biosynthesis
MSKITYLITVYNEVKTVKKSIEDILNIKYKKKEIIIIDNGSTDGSQNIIKKYTKIKKIIRKKNLGYGRTIEEGIEKSTGEYIYIQNSDLEYDEKKSISMLNFAIRKKLDVVLGSRLKKKKKNIIKLLLEKPSYLATIICTYLINKFYNRKFTDIIGAKLYKIKSIKKIPINSYHMGFDFEFISRICKNNYNIGEVYIKYKPREISKDKKIKFYHMFIAFYEIFKVKFFE